MSGIKYYQLAKGEEIPDEFCAVRNTNGEPAEYNFFIPEPPTCTMEPDGWDGEQYGIYKCSSCGELWQFECDGPRENGWTCCPKCKATIDYEEVG